RPSPSWWAKAHHPRLPVRECGKARAAQPCSPPRNSIHMAEARKKGLISHGVAAQNRKARFDYAIKDTVEAGLVLKGPEVKSLRLGRATLNEAWAGEREGEMWL